MIIAKGRLVASDTAENLTGLMASASRLELTLRADDQAVRSVLWGMEGIDQAEYSSGGEGETHVVVTPKGGSDLREALFFAFAQAGLPILEMNRERATLEDVFLELTGSEPAAARGEEEVKPA